MASIDAKSWIGTHPPERILVIRLQALGDTIITLPYLKSLRKQYPDLLIDLLTRIEVSPIPSHLRIFNKVIPLKGGRNAKVQFFFALLKIPLLVIRRYDAVLDLQNNKISRIIRKLLSPKSWTAFDLYSPVSAGERTRRTIEALWRWRIDAEATPVDTSKGSHGTDLLEQNGWGPDYEVVILNPAGFCPSRNWPLKNYVGFAQRWLKSINPHTYFVLLLMPSHRVKAEYLKREIGDLCIDLTGKAGQVEAFEIIAQSSLMLSEDSGLMHMAWTQNIPTVALFSSSRKDWSAPQGDLSVCLDSSDMDCGPCGLEICKYGDNRCLTRYSVDLVLERATQLRLMRQNA